MYQRVQPRQPIPRQSAEFAPVYAPQATAPVLPSQRTPVPQQNAQPKSPAPAPYASQAAAPALPFQRAPASLQIVQPTSPEQDSTAEKIFAPKIFKVNAKDKVVDFTSKLIAAKPEDFAAIHGSGGAQHAPNSTIACTICDYSKGTGEQSVTVSYNIDVEDFGTLYEAAMAARLGQLSPAGDMSVVSASVEAMRGWLSLPDAAQGVKAVPVQQIAHVGKMLADMLARANGTSFSYSKEKNNPYRPDEKGNVPVSKIYLAYTPYRNGEASRYPWLVLIERYYAPLKKMPNGASAHDASKAEGKQSVSINLSADDFCAAMVAVKRYVALWEMQQSSQLRNGLAQIDAQRKANNRR